MQITQNFNLFQNESLKNKKIEKLTTLTKNQSKQMAIIFLKFFIRVKK
jgi:hypothetical protein